MKCYGELHAGCGLETNWLHFGDNPDPGGPFRITIRIREELAFGGGLCSVNTLGPLWEQVRVYYNGVHNSSKNRFS